MTTRSRHRPPPAATRRALLAAATAAFDRHGYRDATVRAICRRAGANVAAVNYHFGDKAALYREVLRHVAREADARRPLALARGERLPGPRRLERFIHGFLRHLLDRGRTEVGSRLMSREMMEPTVALDMVIREQVQPIAEELRAIVTAFLGPRASEPAIRLAGMSIVSQCLFYHQCRPVVRRLFPDLRFETADLGLLAAHLTAFCAAGLRQMARARRRH
jgi:AcrR family transcriptional regulator